MFVMMNEADGFYGKSRAERVNALRNMQKNMSEEDKRRIALRQTA